MFFTFLFPIILVLIFGAIVRTDPGGGGLFAEPPSFYVAGYLAVVVLFTPMSRLASEVARYREGNRFEKLATTPLTRTEWLLAQGLVNVVIATAACAVVLVLVLVLTGADFSPSPLVLAYVVAAVIPFLGIGALLGSYTDSRDGAVTASNAIGLPLLFLSETFVTLAQLPGWMAPIVHASPLTHFARGVRAASDPGSEVAAVGGIDATVAYLGLLVAVGVVAFWLGARSIPVTD